MKTFILNFKNYLEGAGNNSKQIAKLVSELCYKYDVNYFLASPQQSLAMLSQEMNLTIISQHLDNVPTGPTTGFCVPEIAKSYGIKGSLINHSEHRITKSDIKDLVKKLKNLKMISIVCAKDSEEVAEFSQFYPNFIAIEPPELIGTGKAVSDEKPEIVINAINEVRKVSDSIKLLCGAGITNRKDVLKACELGADGILVASGVIKSQNWKATLSDLIEPLS